MTAQQRAVAAVLRAIDDAGPQPKYHADVMRRHRAEWPTLWRAIDEFRASTPKPRTRSPYAVAGATLVPARARFATPARAVVHQVPVLHSDREPNRRALCGAMTSGAWVLRPDWPDRACPLCTEYAGAS